MPLFADKASACLFFFGGGGGGITFTEEKKKGGGGGGVKKACGLRAQLTGIQLSKFAFLSHSSTMLKLGQGDLENGPGSPKEMGTCSLINEI